MNTEIFEMLIKKIMKLGGGRREEIIQLNRNERAFIDEDKKSIELAEAIFDGSSMFCLYDSHCQAMYYILNKLIKDRKLFEEMKDRGTSIIRLFSLLASCYKGFGYHTIDNFSEVIVCSIIYYSQPGMKGVPLEDSILTNQPNSYPTLIMNNDDVRNRLVEDLTKDKTKLDIFLNGILAMKNSDLVLSCINKIQGLNEEDRNYVSRLQKKNMLDQVLNKDDKTLAKIAIKELLKLFILQEKESTTLESPQISGVEHCNGR
ncbi:hypothetical protein [Wolbachia endosymbiont of Tribolium confusum]|uniref:hypothetical protein n=1 Tax=Wolbachia endosymbiont of Tribolium confusum TaxID=214474 RepID=UPI001CF3F7FF|nr:hypothetical protein [Wolbachia endosymbiont of Tribolium confusum]MCA7009816.1 hypothetical protein [Wolbachia endosymbiont of Tribolium confusum]